MKTDKILLFLILGISFFFNANLFSGDNIWTPLGPYGGNVQALATAPDNKTIYAGTQDGGFFKSENSGLSWSAKNIGLDGRYVRDIKINSVNSDTIYAALLGSGVYKSIDKGENWFKLSSGNINNSVVTLAIRNSNINHIFIGTYSGAYRTLDGGKSWIRLSNGITSNLNVTKITLNQKSNTVYLGSISNGIFKSKNNGNSWEPINNGLGSQDKSITDIIIDPSDTNIVYLGLQNSGNTIFKSTNGGSNWTAISNGIGQNNAIWSLFIDPNNSQKLYAGTSKGPWGGIFKTINGGSNWTQIPGMSDNTVWTFAKIQSNLFMGSNVGVFKSINGDSAWINTSNGMDALSINAIQYLEPKVLLTASKTGLYRTENNGITWQKKNNISVTNEQFLSLAVNPQNRKQLYVGTYSDGIFKSIDAGKNWISYSNNLQNYRVSCITISPIDSNLIFLGTISPGSVYKSTNGAVNWTKLTSGLPANFNLLSIKINPHDKNVIYAGTQQQGIYKSINGGNLWEAKNNGLQDLHIHSLAIDPDSTHIIYAGTESGIFRSQNSGETWVSINTNFLGNQVNDIIINSQFSNLLYAATEKGVYITPNRGNNWNNLSAGLRPTDSGMNSIASIQHEDSTLFWAGTERSSVWSMTLLNAPPEFDLSQLPLTSAKEGNLYQTTLKATDKNALDILSFSLLKSPIGMTIKNLTNSCQIEWTPDNSQVSDVHSVTVGVEDPFKRSDSINFNINVQNSKPQIFSIEDQILKQDEKFVLDINCDEEKENRDIEAFNRLLISYRLELNPPGWIKFSTHKDSLGFLIGRPKNKDVGKSLIQVVVNDGHGLEDRGTFFISVENLQPKIITPVPSSTIDEDMPFYHDVNSSEDGDENIRYYLKHNPVWMKIDSVTGIISGTPTNAHVTLPGKPAEVEIIVDDGNSIDSIDVQNFNIEIKNQPSFIDKTILQTKAVPNRLYECDLYCNDEGEGSTAYYKIKLPKWVNLDIKSGLISGTPSLLDIGKDTISVGVNDGNGAADSISYIVEVLGNYPRIYIAESQQFIQFGNIIINDSVSKQISLKNMGNSDLSISSISIKNIDQGVYKLFYEKNKLNKISPLDSFELEIRYKPFKIGSFPNFIEIKCNDPIEPSKQISLLGYGVDAGLAPKIYTAEKNHNFQMVSVKDTSKWTLKIQNQGSQPLIVNEINNTNPVFIVEDKSFTIEANSGKNIIVKFIPNEVRHFIDILEIFNNDSSQNIYSIKLEGVGKGPKIHVSEMLVNFGKNSIISEGKKSISVKNFGNSELTIDSLVVKSDNFSCRDISFFLAPAKEKMIEISFSPKKVETYNGILEIYSTDLIEPLKKIVLTGQGKGGILTPSAKSHNFEKVHVFQTETWKLVLTNSGNDTLQVTDIVTSKPEFNISPKKIKISPDSSTQITVSFTPKQKQNYEDKATLSLNNSVESKQEILLEGIGSQGEIKLAQKTLDFKSVKIDTNREKRIWISNVGNDYLRLSDFRQTRKDSIFKFYAPGSGIIAESDSLKLDLSFKPIRAANYSDTLIFNTDDPVSQVVRITLIGRGTSRSGTKITHIPVTLAKEYLPIEIKAEIQDTLNGISNISLLYRKPYQISATSLDFSTKVAIIPGKDVTFNGLEYQISVKDNADNVTTKPESGFYSIQVIITGEGKVIQTAESNITGLSYTNLFSIPLILDNPAAKLIMEDDLGPYNKEFWRLFEYKAGVYLEYPTISNIMPGKSFVLILAKPNQLIDTGSGITAPTDENSIYRTIPLSDDWNFIGNPFNFTINREQLSYLKGEPVTHIWGFENNTWIFQPELIEPWKGYIVKPLKKTSLCLNPNKPLKKEPVTTFETTNNNFWELTLKVNCGSAQDNFNIAGVRFDAKNTWDSNDIFEPPPIGDFVNLYFPHLDWPEHPDLYTADYQLPDNEGNFWDFVIKTNLTNKPVSITVTGLELLPADFKILLLDKNLAVSQDISKRSIFSFIPSSQKADTFRLVVGKESYLEKNRLNIELAPTTYEFKHPFPNPFNQVTTIIYSLPISGKVTVDVFNSIGQKIKNLMNSHQEIGRYLLFWDGTDTHNLKVASGIYYIQINVNNYNMTRSVTLIQ